MPNVLPTVRGGRTQVQYPFTRRTRFQTMICISANGSEQRAAGRGVPLFEGVLNYTRLPKSERDSINTFFKNMGGQVSLWGFSALGVSYANCKFTQDVIQWREGPMNLYSATLNWRQVNNSGFTIPSVGGSIPALTSTAFCQLPYAPEWRQLTSTNDQPSGWAYSTSWYGQSRFPSTAGLRRWGLGNPVLSDADALAIENDFIGRLGMWAAVSVTDPEDSTVHANCRYGSDVLEIQYQGFGQTAVSVVLEETNG